MKFKFNKTARINEVKKDLEDNNKLLIEQLKLRDDLYAELQDISKKDAVFANQSIKKMQEINWEISRLRNKINNLEHRWSELTALMK